MRGTILIVLQKYVSLIIPVLLDIIPELYLATYRTYGVSLLPSSGYCRQFTEN
jgi:hypothetical protein